jgi:DNA-binding IclR family transcriptional regulator
MKDRPSLDARIMQCIATSSMPAREMAASLRANYSHVRLCIARLSRAGLIYRNGHRGAWSISGTGNNARTTTTKNETI